jgi:hypothetical protein
MRYLIRLLVIALLAASISACSAEENRGDESSDEPDQPVCDAIGLRCCDDMTGRFVQDAECTTDGLKCPDGTAVDACELNDDIDEETTEPQGDAEPVCDAIAIRCCDPSSGEVIGDAECTRDGLKCPGEGSREACGDRQEDVSVEDGTESGDTDLARDAEETRTEDTSISDTSGLPDDKCRNSQDCRSDEDGSITPKQCIAPGEFTGCGSGCAMPGQTCQDDSECGGTEVCVDPPPESCICSDDKVCRPACQSDADCGDFELCTFSGRCEKRTCSSDSDCDKAYATCREGDCSRMACDADGECPSDAKCVKGECYGRFGDCRFIPR